MVGPWYNMMLLVSVFLIEGSSSPAEVVIRHAVHSAFKAIRTTIAFKSYPLHATPTIGITFPWDRQHLSEK